MAIKVKHEGNATSRLMAAGAGGKGRRRAEDAKWLTQIASQENMANRRVAEPRFIQAHAQGPSSAPLVQAHAGGGSAPLMGAPGIPQPHPLPSRGTTFSPVTSPGGFKKGRRGQGGGAAAAGGRGGIAAGGAMPGNLVQVKQGPNPAWELRDDKGQAIRKYSEAQMRNVVGRYDLGSTMDEIDQMAGFRFRGGKTEQELAEEQAQQKAVADAAKRQADANEFDRREGVKSQNRQIEAQQKQEFEAQQKVETDRRDYLRRAREEEGYSHEQILQLEDIYSDIAGYEKDPTLSEEDRQAKIDEAKEKAAKITPLHPPKSLQDEYNDSIVTDSETGMRYRKDAKGNFVPVEASETPATAADVYGGTHVDENGRRWGVDKSGKLYEVGVEKDAFGDLMKLVPDTKTKTEIDPKTGKSVEVEVPLTMNEKLDYLNQLKQMRDQFNARPVPGTGANGGQAGATDPVLAARSGASSPLALADGYIFAKSGDDNYDGQFIMGAGGTKMVGFRGTDGRELIFNDDGTETPVDAAHPAPWAVQPQPAPSAQPGAVNPDDDEFAEYLRKSK